MRRSRWVTGALLLAVVVVIGLSLLLGSHRGQGAAPFAGTDAQAVATLERSGASPWLAPLLRPASPEIESGLFALQAAVGGGVLGFALGSLRGRAAARTAPGCPLADERCTRGSDTTA